MSVLVKKCLVPNLKRLILSTILFLEFGRDRGPCPPVSRWMELFQARKATLLNERLNWYKATLSGQWKVWTVHDYTWLVPPAQAHAGWCCWKIISTCTSHTSFLCYVHWELVLSFNQLVWTQQKAVAGEEEQLKRYLGLAYGPSQVWVWKQRQAGKEGLELKFQGEQQ